MRYNVILTPDAQNDLLRLQKHAPNVLKKLASLFEELREHPRTGTGQVEQLKGFKHETWSRRLNKEHRIVYEVYEAEIRVLVISAFGHYNN